jgi:hypothetical protein
LYKDIFSSEIFEDGVTITKTVRSSQIGGALIGGLALGGVGAVVGGLTGKTQASDKVDKVDLRLTVNDTKNPIFNLNFLNLPMKKNDTQYKQAIERARHWHGLIEVLIKLADNEDKAVTKMKDPPKPLVGSIADELKKLAELRDEGILSVDEFQQQKLKLLGD